MQISALIKVQTEIMSLGKVLPALLLLFTVLGADAAPREIRLEVRVQPRTTTPVPKIRHVVQVVVPRATGNIHAGSSDKGSSGEHEKRPLTAGELICVVIIAALLAICGCCAKCCSRNDGNKKENDQVILITAEITEDGAPRPYVPYAPYAPPPMVLSY